MHSLYIHIPFCEKKCHYCNFYSIEANKALAKEYVSILAKQIKRVNAKVKTVYIGGGTPSVLSVSLLKLLLDSLKDKLLFSSENTIEVNPESITIQKLSLLRKYNINRLSFGVQSFDNQKLKFLGRIHNSQKALRMIEEAKKCGFDNIGIDLIYGVPSESLADWKKELTQAISLPITHISCYSLTCEPKTIIYRCRKEIDSKEVADMYRFNMSFLPNSEFKQYEVSNFAKSGFRSKHNLSYWDNSSYIGLGPSAVSYLDNKRGRNICDIKKYIERVKINKSTVSSSEKLSPIARAREFASLSIRKKEGIDLERFFKICGMNLFDIITVSEINKLADKGLLKLKIVKGVLNKISLTRKGFLFADSVSSEFF